jgi:hypothetical protein
LIVVSALIACSLAQGTTTDDAQTITYKYNAACMKGFIDGYYQGMYKQPAYTVNTLCLANNTINDLNAINTAYDSGNFSFTLVAIPV